MYLPWIFWKASSLVRIVWLDSAGLLYFPENDRDFMSSHIEGLSIDSPSDELGTSKACFFFFVQERLTMGGIAVSTG